MVNIFVMSNGVPQSKSSDIWQYIKDDVSPEVLSLFLDLHPNAIHELDAVSLGLDAYNPIHVAAAAGKTEIVELLQSKGADINAPSLVQKHTPLTLAIEGQHVSTIQYLVDAGVNVNLQVGDTHPLLLAVRQTQAVLEAVLAAPDIDLNIQDVTGRTALNAAFYKGNELHAKMLYERGADINLAMKNGRTPLMAAGHGCCEQGIAYLLAQKVDPNLVDNEGYTALHYTPLHDSYGAAGVKTAEALLRGGVYYDLVNKFNDTAFDIARDIASNQSSNEHKTALHRYFCKIQDEPWVKRKPGPDLAFVHKGMPVKTTLMKRVQLRPRGI